ncbi:MAG: hypothetical protein GX296_07670 [Bacteroidales bacterium]|jgi:beta-lactamase class D|nr:hypothetical protein [Bacteroidales bacterium]
MKNVFRKDKSELVARNQVHVIETLTEESIKELAEPLKKYLRVCGYINTLIPVNADVYWSESWLKMSQDQDWRKIHTIHSNGHPN